MTFADWAQFGATLTLGIIALAVAIFGPYMADLVRRRYLAPRLLVQFRAQYGFRHLTKKRYSPFPKGHPSYDSFEEYPTYYFRFSVYNCGRSLARSCEVVLQEVLVAAETGDYQPMEVFWPTNLTWEDGGRQIDINPKRPPLFTNIGHICHPEAQKKFEPSQSVRVSPSETRLRFILDLHVRHFAKIDSLAQGKYVLKVAIVGENFDQIRKQFSLSWSGNWTEDEGQMLTKDAFMTMSDW